MKSRQLGFTTFECVDSFDDTLFKQNHNSLIISYDANSSTDIFDTKIDFAWKNFKEDVSSLASRYTVDADNNNSLKFEFGNGSSSSVSVRQSGRSGTYQRVHISEFAKICLKYPLRAKEIITGTLPAVPLSGRIDIESTAEGAEGYFYEMFMDAWDNKDFDPVHDYKAHFYNWQWDKEEIASIETRHDLPPQFQAYRNKVKKEYGIDINDQELTYYYTKWKLLKKDWELLKQEYPTTPEEAFDVALAGCYYMKQMRAASEEGRLLEFDIEPSLPIYTWWDLGLDDENVCGLFQFFENEIRLVKVIHGSDEEISYYLKKLKAMDHPGGIEEINFPWDGNIRNLATKTSSYDVANSPEYFKGKVKLVRNTGKMEGINACRRTLPRVWFNIGDPGVVLLVKAMRYYRKERDEKRNVWKNTPNHDWTSHYADMMRYMSLDQYDRPKVQTKPKQYVQGNQKPAHEMTDFDQAFPDEDEPMFTF